MKIFLPNQRGFAPAVLLVILAAIGVTGVGTVSASNASNPGDVLFGLDKAAEELRVAFSPGDEAKAKIRLEIAEERLEELQTLENVNQPVTPAVVETHQALNNATVAVNNVEVKFKENKIKLRSTDLQALLTELQALLATHQGLIRRVEIKIEDGEVRAKIKLFEQEATESAELIDDDLDDLEDDGLLNASFARMLEVELKGVLANTGAGFQITHGGKTYTLTTGAGINLATFAGKLVEVKGFASNETPTNVTVTKIELEDEIEDDEEELEVEGLPEVEVKGFIRSSGGGFTLTFNGGTVLYTLTSQKVNLASFVNKFVEAEGVLSGNVLQVHEVKVKKTDSSGKPVVPALQQSSASDDNDEDDDDNDSNSGSSGSNSGSGSSNSGSSDSGKDEPDDD